MPWVLFGLSLWLGALTLNARFPSRRSFAQAPSFFAAWLTIELAAHLLALDVAATVVLCVFGALDSWPGWVGLVLAIMSWLGLIVMVAEARRSTATMRDCLADLAERTDAGGLEDAVRVPWWSPIVPFWIRRKGMQATRGVEFARAGGRRLRLDVFTPADTRAGARRPAILQIHGGAWVLGFRRQQAIPLRNHLVANGWAWIDADYRLAPFARWPDFLVDCKCALAWIREHATEYAIDPSFVCVTGNSAGGHLASLVALTANDARYQPGFEAADTSVQAAVPIYGIYDFTNRNGTMEPDFVPRFLEPWVMKAFRDDEPDKFRDASPIDQVRPDAPPILVVHGDRDTLAPVADARLFVERLRSVASEPVLYAELRGAQHAFDTFASIRTLPVIEGIEQFLRWVYVGHLTNERGVASPVAQSVDT